MDELARAKELLKKLADLDVEIGKRRQEEMELHAKFVRGLEELTELLSILLIATGVRRA